MNGHDTGLDELPEDSPDDVAAMSRLLRYERYLEGDAFTAIVVAQAATSRRRRGWILSGCAAVSAVCVVVLMPANWLSFDVARLPWQGLGASMSAIPIVTIVAAVAGFAIMLGLSASSDAA